MIRDQKQIAIIGAGLVGSLLAIYLSRRGYVVSVFERRSDMRTAELDAGKSINLALSNRGLRALREVGLEETVKAVAIPMHGRMIHDVSGVQSFQPYGKEGEFINSISRSDLNQVLLGAAEKSGANFFFGQKCVDIDIENTAIKLSNAAIRTFDLIFGADGVWSAARDAMVRSGRFDYSQSFIDHGYKEFRISPNSTLDRNALHIWPRASFMMIALPNPDGSFTATLFYPWQGVASFQSLNNDGAITEFFENVFPDFVQLAPDYLKDFHANPTGSLLTVACWPWTRNNVALIGDAAHGIVPFYGQGMNAGFEDCSVLYALIESHGGDWAAALSEFQSLRKPDTDKIAKLALDNFVEMRDLVADENFKLRKKIEAMLHDLYPEKWIPLYSMITFHDEMRYSDAFAIGLRQQTIMDDVMRQPDIHKKWNELDLGEVVARL